MQSTHTPVPTQDPRNRGRYLTEAATVVIVFAILLTSEWSRDLGRSWWMWLGILAGFAYRAWRFRRDLRRYERWHETLT